MSYSKGPWRHSFKTTKTQNLGIYNDAGVLLASVDVHQLAGQNVVARRVADARLIAAAPELLEALESIRDCCEEDHAARDYASRQTEIRGIARAAIAKATGEQA